MIPYKITVDKIMVDRLNKFRKMTTGKMILNNMVESEMTLDK